MHQKLNAKIQEFYYDCVCAFYCINCKKLIIREIESEKSLFAKYTRCALNYIKNDFKIRRECF